MYPQLLLMEGPRLSHVAHILSRLETPLSDISKYTRMSARIGCFSQ